MPTGYTCYIEDGDIKTGKDFLMLCTRAFGIALDVRDEPLSVPTPTKFYPSQYSTERLNKAKKNVEYWERITLDEAREIYIQRHKENVESSIMSLEFAERMKRVVDEYNNRRRDEAFANEVLDDVAEQLAQLLEELKKEKDSFKDMGIDYEEKAFYDILSIVARKYEFE